MVCVIESDKAQVEVESFDAGVLRIPVDSPAPGAKVPVGTVLGYVLAPGETLPSPRARTAVESRSRRPATAPPPRGAATPRARDQPGPARGADREPRARRVAAELRVDWTLLGGTGRTGRIVERDVRSAGVPTARVRCAGSSPSG